MPLAADAGDEDQPTPSSSWTTAWMSGSSKPWGRRPESCWNGRRRGCRARFRRSAKRFMQIACIGWLWYLGPMAVHLQIRDLPVDLHQTLRQRAAKRGLSLRQYTLEVLLEHCRQPTLDDWLEGLHRLPKASLSSPASEIVRQARDADDSAVIHAIDRR